MANGEVTSRLGGSFLENETNNLVTVFQTEPVNASVSIDALRVQGGRDDTRQVN